jgi:hypothetical protein
MTPDLAFECLLVSHDPAVYSTVDRVLRNFSINVNYCLSSSKASQAVSEKDHDLVVVDWEGPASSDLLYAIWESRNKKQPTILAISDEAQSITGAHLVLRKPFTTQSATASLKTAYSRMLLDHRLNARFPLMTRVSVRNESGQCFPATITDIGEGGVGLISKEQLNVGDLLWFSVQLPDVSADINIHARVVWTRSYGAAGCQIIIMPPVDRDLFRDWLKSKVRVKKPLISA